MMMVTMIEKDGGGGNNSIHPPPQPPSTPPPLPLFLPPSLPPFPPPLPPTSYSNSPPLQLCPTKPESIALSSPASHPFGMRERGAGRGHADGPDAVGRLCLPQGHGPALKPRRSQTRPVPPTHAPNRPHTLLCRSRLRSHPRTHTRTLGSFSAVQTKHFLSAGSIAGPPIRQAEEDEVEVESDFQHCPPQCLLRVQRDKLFGQHHIFFMICSSGQ